MRVKMLVDAPGSPDGVNVLQYAADSVYDVSDDLGAVFVAEKFAEETEDDLSAEAPEQTDADSEAADDETEQAEADASKDAAPPADDNAAPPAS